MVVSPSTPPTVPPPPPPTLRERLQLWWDSRDALPRMQRWLALRAAPVVLLTATLYSLNGALVGWATAYEVLVGITSPAEVQPQWCAWPLSLAGWAVLPALIGGLVGYVVAAQIESHRSRELAEILADLHQRAEPPRQGGS